MVHPYWDPMDDQFSGFTRKPEQPKINPIPGKKYTGVINNGKVSVTGPEDDPMIGTRLHMASYFGHLKDGDEVVLEVAFHLNVVSAILVKKPNYVPEKRPWGWSGGWSRNMS